jgi:magnesium and cobalt exporter, CNNM family
VLEKGEHQLITGVLRLGDRAVRSLMTPRTDVDWIDATRDEAEIKERLIAASHSRLPAGEGSPDKIIGVVKTPELLAALQKGEALDVKKHVRHAPIIPETTDALDVLTILREAEVPMALIHDEYGHFEGLVTPADVLEAIAGVFRSDAMSDLPHAVERADGSWLLAGAMPADEMADIIGIVLPEKRDYQTVGGFVLSQLRHLPKTGETVEAGHWRFEVMDMDGRRIDKVLASRAVRGRQAKRR